MNRPEQIRADLRVAFPFERTPISAEQALAQDVAPLLAERDAALADARSAHYRMTALIDAVRDCVDIAESLMPPVKP